MAKDTQDNAAYLKKGAGRHIVDIQFHQIRQRLSEADSRREAIDEVRYTRQLAASG